MTEIKPIRDDKSYHEALERIETLWGTASGTPAGDELDVWLTLVEVYENNHFPMPPSDPIDAIRFRMDQLDLRRKDLEQFIGPRSRVSEFLNRKRPLSLKQIIRLHRGMGIPYESLIDENQIVGSDVIPYSTNRNVEI